MGSMRSLSALVLVGLSLSVPAWAQVSPPAAATQPAGVVCDGTTGHAGATDEGACAGNPGWALPKWRISAGVTYYSSNPSVGLHRRISERCDLGLELSTTVRAGWSEGEQDVQGYGDDYDTGDDDADERSSDLGLYAELRRWRPMARRLAWFGGLRLVATYSHDGTEQTDFHDSEERWEDTRLERDTDYLSLGAALTLGADLELMQRLSAGFALSPLTLSHYWRHTSSTTVRTRSDRDEEQVLSDEDWERGLRLYTSLAAEVHLTLSL